MPPQALFPSRGDNHPRSVERVIAIPEFDIHPTYLLPTIIKDKTGEQEILAAPAFVPPTRVQLYRKIPQSTDMTYKCEATFCSVLFVLVKNCWLEPLVDDMVDAFDIFLPCTQTMKQLSRTFRNFCMSIFQLRLNLVWIMRINHISGNRRYAL